MLHIYQKLEKTLFLIIILVVCFPLVLHADTGVGGIIYNDTTWTMADSPFIITGDVQIPFGTTLTLEPGVVVNLMEEGNAIKVWGNLNAVGTDEAHIIFNNVIIDPGGYGPENELFVINIQYSELNGGSLYGATGQGVYGNLILKNSILRDMGLFYLWYPEADCFIERNIFLNSVGFSIGLHCDVKAYIKNNIFYQQTGNSETDAAIENWASYSNSETIVEYNSFLSTDRIALALPGGV